MFIHFLCLCPLRLAIMLNFNISKVAYWSGAVFTIGLTNQHTNSAIPHLFERLFLISWENNIHLMSDP